MQPARPQHAAHADHEQRNGKSEANPKTQAHAAQLVIVFLRCAYCNAWLKRHATDRTDSGPVGENLRMHWARVFLCMHTAVLVRFHVLATGEYRSGAGQSCNCCGGQEQARCVFEDFHSVSGILV